MKILFITHYTALYGANRSLLALAKQLKLKDYKVVIMVPGYGDLNQELKKNKIPFVETQYYDEYYYKRGFSRLLGLKRHIINRLKMKSLMKIVNQIQPDIIHSNSAALQVGAKLAYRLKIPHVWHIREFGLEDYRAVYNLGWQNHLKWLNRADYIIAISEVLKKAVLSEVLVPVKVIYNGVMTTKKMEKLSFKKTTSEKVVFALVASFRPEKGHEIALDAFIKIADKLPQAELFLPGDHEQAFGNKLKAKSIQTGLSKKVKFPGFINDPQKIYEKTDILLMCSKSEAMGRVTAEAFAHCIPVIAHKGGANPELIQQDIEGILYEDQEALCEAMIKLGDDQSLREKMGNLAHKKALGLFTEESYAEEVEKVYIKIQKDLN